MKLFNIIRSRSSLKFLTGLGCIVASIPLILLCINSFTTPPLVAKSKQLHVNLNLYDIFEDSYRWATDNSLYLLTNKPEGDSAVWYSVIVNLSTNTSAPFSRFNQSMRVDQLTSAFGWSASPTGKRLIWAGGSNKHREWMLLDRTTNILKTYPRPKVEYQYCAWMPDGERWIEYNDSVHPYATIHDTNLLKSDSYNVQMPRNIFLLGGTDHNSILSYRQVDRCKSKVLLYDTDLTTGKTHTNYLAISALSKIYEIVLSPQGNRVVVRVETQEYDNPFVSLFKRFHGEKELAFTLRTDVMICKTDGTIVKNAGMNLEHEDPTLFYDIPHGPRNFAWLPNGTQFSYTYRDDIWVCSAD